MTTRMSPAVPTTVDDAFDLVRRATDPEALFGPHADAAGGLRAGVHRYRALARLVHPDVVPATRAAQAQAAFARLGHLWDMYQRGPAGVSKVTLSTRRRTYTVGAEFARGDVASLHTATYSGTDGANVHVVLKVPRSVRDNDLMGRETAALRRLAGVGDDTFAAYVPRLVETFRHRVAASGAERRTNVLEHVGGFHSLTEVRAVYPGGLDARDVAWMWRRLLVALGYAHRAGVVHGAVVPDHVLVRPRDHGLVLVDWCYSVVAGPGHGASGGHIPAMVDRFADMYPPEVPARQPPGEATDVFMATNCMTYLLNDDAPAPMLRFARGCTLPAASRRPHDAWQVLREFDEMLERLYGPRRFRPFHMSNIRFDGTPTR